MIPLFPAGEGPGERGQIAAYARDEDYHDVLPARMKELVQFIEEQVGGPVKNRWYTDTGPILERDLAQRAASAGSAKTPVSSIPNMDRIFCFPKSFSTCPSNPIHL